MELWANADESIIHVASPVGGGEYMFCGLEIQEGSCDPAYARGPEDGLHMVDGVLPNCKECKEAIDAIRQEIRGVRFSRKLKSIDEVMMQ
jgi:hypothetical protein